MTGSVQVLWLGPPKDSEAPDQIVVALQTVRQAEELYAQLRNESERMTATGATGQIVLKGRLRK